MSVFMIASAGDKAERGNGPDAENRGRLGIHGIAGKSAEPIHMLCETCHQREANHHITDIKGNVMQKRDLCPECFLASCPDASVESRRLATVQRDARCVYCGGQPYLAGTVLVAILSGDPDLRFVCIPCSIEHNRYLQEHSQEDVSALSEQERSDLLRKLHEEADRHMKEWVPQRVHGESA